MPRPGLRRSRRVALPLATALAVVAGLLAAPIPAGAAVVQVKLKARHSLIKVARGVRMRAWTFNGQVPAPLIRVREGDRVEVTLVNRAIAHGNHRPGTWHSIDFHAARVAPNLAFKSVAPGERHTFSFVAERPGVYLYHCGTSPVLEHLGRGMYGAIVVDPAEGRPPAKEITLVQSEYYGEVRKHRLRPSLEAMRHGSPTFVAFNGRAFRYVTHPITVPVDRPVRIYVVDGGPTLDSNFHVIGTIFDVVQPDGSPFNELHDVSTHLVPAGGAALFELTFPEQGDYPFVTHAFRFADAGAIGRFVAREPG